MLGGVANLGDPVVVHVFQEVVAAEWLEEGADVGARVGGHGGAVLEAVGGVGRRDGVVLAVQVAVLRVGAVAEIWPQSMQCPVIGRKQLTLGLEASVCRPELGREEQSSVCFGATRIDGVRVGGAGARQNGVGVGCGGIALACADGCRIGSSHSLN